MKNDRELRLGLKYGVPGGLLRVAARIFTAAIFAPIVANGCGLDWTLPTNHFDGVEEHGYVSYWEKIGEFDLGKGLVIPVNINFNSHRESTSPYLGKGWLVALLESHVEPLDENNVKVIMPDGWNFYFHRDGSAETWHGNAGWVGETNNTVFTIAAPCGWRIKFDGGKIQEIDGSKNQTLSYKYNGPIACEVDSDGKPCVVFESDPSAGGPAKLIMGAQTVALALAHRPRVVTRLDQNLVTGFDPSLSALQWPDGKKESFVFGTDKRLNPTLTITSPDQDQHDFTWDAVTRQIKADGNWSYGLEQMNGHLKFTRTLPTGLYESFEGAAAPGLTIEKSLNGVAISTYRFTNGPLAGQVRKVEDQQNGLPRTLYSASYFPSGRLMREVFYPNKTRIYTEMGKLIKETVGNDVTYEQDYDAQGHLIHILNPAQQFEVKRSYDSLGNETTQVFKNGVLFYTEHADRNNKLTALNPGSK